MRIKILNRNSELRGQNRHQSEQIMKRALAMPYKKKMVIEEKKAPMKVYDRLKHYNTVYGLGMEVSIKGNIITVMKKYAHRVSINGTGLCPDEKVIVRLNSEDLPGRS